jgi:hypothetical protein
MFSVNILAQGLNNLWLGGYANWAAPPNGGVDLQFQGGSLVISSATRDIGYKRTTANITDMNGDLLFSTNGVIVANALGDTMLNGDGLNPGDYVEMYPEGIHAIQGALILPKPEDPSTYFLFHMTVDDQVGLNAEQLYLTTIDMSLDGWFGGVVSKNQPILIDDLNVGRLTAVRHANGRDWWVFCHKINTDTFYRLLVTPNGVSVDGTQSIGATRPADNGQACFSPDGSQFAYYWGEPGTDLDLFQFDRCTGQFSDPIYIPIDDYDGGGGVAFSPNSRFVYVSSVFDVYQFDTQAGDIAVSVVNVAHWDSTYSPDPPFATLFNLAQLAPDGKIYIGTGNSTFHLHVIHDPNEPGLSCNMEQHGIELPRWFSNSLPNHPNYHLGPIDGSVCDSLGINEGIEAIDMVISLHAYPNPSDGAFTITYPPQADAGLLEVRDLSGRSVLRDRVPQWSQVHGVDLSGVPPGMYECMITWKEQRSSIRVMLHR